MSNPEQTTQPSSATPNPSIIDSSEFQGLLEKLHTNNDREILVDIIKEQEHLEQEMEQNIMSNPYMDILENMENLNNHVIACPGFSVEDHSKLILAEVELRLDLRKMEEVLADMDLKALKISDISERGEYVAGIFQKGLDMKLEILRKLRRVYHDLPSLTPDELKFIDERLDNMEQAQDVPLTRGRMIEIYLETWDKQRHSTIPFVILKEALFLLSLPKPET